MQPLILAGRAILFRFLRLVITITVESFIYQKTFRISPKRGIEYAIIIDLFAEIFGAILFTFLQSNSPLNPSRHLIIYLFLDDFQKVAVDVLILSLFYFLVFLFIKWIGLLFINTFVYESENQSSDGDKTTSNLEKTTQWGEQFKAITKAHTVSYSVTLLFALFTMRVFYL